jgi:hypothetical protein
LSFGFSYQSVNYTILFIHVTGVSVLRTGLIPSSTRCSSESYLWEKILLSHLSYSTYPLGLHGTEQQIGILSCPSDAILLFRQNRTENKFTYHACSTVIVVGEGQGLDILEILNLLN